MYKILVVNPGSTSTKIAVFEDSRIVFENVSRHSTKELAPYKTVYEQYEFRREVIIEELNKENISLEDLDAVVGRGGLLKAVEGGSYEVNKAMLEDLKSGVSGEHASNLGGILAYEIAQRYGSRAFIVDPVVVDELDDIARISGIKEIERASIFHALNQKSVAKRYARSIRKNYEDLNLIVAHLGGGISVGTHKRGRVIDVANALDGEGPFSPERSGSLPVGSLVKLCYSGKYTVDEMNRMIKGCGGLVSYLNTNSAIEVENMIDAKDDYARLIYEAMAYQVSKEIGAASAVLKGQVDGIILTGGMTYSEVFINWIRERIGFISDLIVYPGEDELKALFEGGLRVLKGEEEAKEYI